MKQVSLVLFGAILSAGCGTSKSTTSSDPEISAPEISYQHPSLPVKIEVDGKLNEWPEPLPGYDKETSIHYGITNNKDFLFIAVSTSEQPMQTKILRTGLEVYISANGKKEKTTGIAFPLPSQNAARLEGRQGTEGPEEQRSAGSMRKAVLSRDTQLRVFGFKKLADGDYPLSTNNCKVVMDWGENNFLNIEYAIPLTELFANNANTANLQIGFDINGFKANGNGEGRGSSTARVGGSNRGGGMRSGGGGGMGGRMHGGGGENWKQGEGRSMEQGMQNTTKEQTFWTRYAVQNSTSS
jgi:hypothetical protein